MSLGDLTRKYDDPLDKYFDVMQQGVGLNRRKWIVKPDWDPRKLPGMESVQELIECHGLPRLWQVLADFFITIQKGTYFVKRPTWIEPPITARPLDLRNNTAVVVGATNTNVVTFTVPDRYVGSFLAFGHNLTLATEFGTVVWNIMINERPVETYFDFTQQIGTYVDPTPLPMPIRVKHGDVIEVTARTAGAAVSAFARLAGFMFPVTKLTQDGSWDDYKVI